MVDVFCRDVPHLDQILRNEVESIEGAFSVTSYLVTQVRYESSTNMASLLIDDSEDAGALRPTGTTKSD